MEVNPPFIGSVFPTPGQIEGEINNAALDGTPDGNLQDVSLVVRDTVNPLVSSLLEPAQDPTAS